MTEADSSEEVSNGSTVVENGIANGNHSNPPPQSNAEKKRPPQAYFNLAYLKSPLAAIRITEIVFGIIFCCLVGTYCREHFEPSGLYYRVCYSARYYYNRGYGGLAFELLIGSISILIAIFFLLIHVLSIPAARPRIPWSGIEILIAISWCFLFFLCWAIHAKYTHDRIEPLYQIEAQLYSQFLAATLFGVLNMLLQAVDVAFQYRSWGP